MDQLTEMELAAELLAAQSEAELDQALDKTLRRVGSVPTPQLDPDLTRSLRGHFERAVRWVLPATGRAAAQQSPRLRPGAARTVLGLELEGLSPEEQEFEVARGLVRLGAAAAKQAARRPPGGSPHHTAAAVFSQSLREHAPGFLRYQPQLQTQDRMHDIDTIRFEADPTSYETTDAFESDAPLNEADEEMLAAELLGVGSEPELDQFLGKLIKKAAKGLRTITPGLRRLARPLVGTLKNVAKAALPTVGAALGSVVPGAGTAVGSMLGGALSNALEPEFEVGDDEEYEFEKAKRVVRLAGNAVREGARTHPAMNRKAAVARAVRGGLQRMRRRRGPPGRPGRFPARPPGRPWPPPQPPAAATAIPPATEDPLLAEPDTGGPDPLADVDLGLDGDTGSSAATIEPTPELEWESTMAPAAPMGGERSGRWVRRGGKIILIGV